LGLTEANRGALAQVRAHAQRERPRHMARIASGLAGARVEPDAEVLPSAASREGVLTLNLHPDRLLADGRSVAQAPHEEGLYRIADRRLSLPRVRRRRARLDAVVELAVDTPSPISATTPSSWNHDGPTQSSRRSGRADNRARLSMTPATSEHGRTH
jgi:hypothetical protein